MATPMEQSMAVMVTTFHKYSGKEGDKYTLSRGELKDLLSKELPTFCQKSSNEATFQKLMSSLDSNKDNQIDFQEFCVFISCLTMICNEFFQEYDEKLPRGK